MNYCFNLPLIPEAKKKMPFTLPQYNSNDWKVLKDLQATQYRRYDGYDATHKIAF